MAESLVRLAHNQSLFREVNERIEDLAGSNEAVEFVCECSDPECISTVQLEVVDYERIRGKPTWFFVKVGHDIPQIERVVNRKDGYVVVEKLVETEFAKEVDPRSEDPS